MIIYIVVLNYWNEDAWVGMTENLGIFSTIEKAKNCLESHIDDMSDVNDSIVILRAIVDEGIKEKVIEVCYNANEEVV